MCSSDLGAARKLSEEEARLAPPVSGDTARDRRRTVYERGGDIYLYDFSTDKATQLTKTAEAERNPHFTQDEQRVAFTRGGNLFVMPLGAGPVEQLTQIQPFGTGRQEPKPADPKTSQGTLQIQEKNLIGAVREDRKSTRLNSSH